MFADDAKEKVDAVEGVVEPSAIWPKSTAPAHLVQLYQAHALMEEVID